MLFLRRSCLPRSDNSFRITSRQIFRSLKTRIYSNAGQRPMQHAQQSPHDVFFPSSKSQLCLDMVFGISLYQKHHDIHPEPMISALNCLAKEMPYITGRIKDSSFLSKSFQANLELNNKGFEFYSSSSEETIESIYQASFAQRHIDCSPLQHCPK